MKLAVFPFNAVGDTPPALGRQIANFAVETVRAATGTEIATANFLVQLPDQEGRVAYVNMSDAMFEGEQIRQFFQQADMDRIMDGSIERTDGNYKLTVRVHSRDEETPLVNETREFSASDVFQNFHWLVKVVADNSGAQLPPELGGQEMEFGTDNPDSFIHFLEGIDALSYVQQANGMVAQEFSPEIGLGNLLQSIKEDQDFQGPFLALVQLCRACAAYQIGNFDMIRSALLKATELEPEDFNAWFGLGEIHERGGDLNAAAEYFEKAIQYEPNEPSLYARLGIVQMNLGMPVNAERNFRKAVELEDENKPSLDLLANVLQATNRAHEVPALWKSEIERNPQNAQAHAKYAMSLAQSGRPDEAEKAFEAALETVEENVFIKRFYAPMLAQKQDLDRAMDFYEDCIDVAPNDVQLLLEYAQTLQAADREFEIPEVLKNVLNSNPDPNTRAQTLAWLIELEQPKRAENVEEARKKMEAGDHEGAVQILKPLRNWLADYWKLWGMLASAYNSLNQPEEAEDAARRLLNLFPGCEPAYGELREALIAQGKAEEAYVVMRNAAFNMPQSLSVHVNLGLAAQAAGHTEEAQELANKIREATGDNPELKEILGQIEGK